MTTLRLHIDGPERRMQTRGPVPAQVLARVLNETLPVLNELSHTVGGLPLNALTWNVTELSIGSIDMALQTSAPFDVDRSVTDHVVEGFVVGLNLLETGDRLPPFFSDAALEHVRKMAIPFNGKRAFRMVAKLDGVDTEAQVTHDTATNVRALLAPRNWALGSVTGRVETISVHGEPAYRIYERITNRPVTCKFGPDQLPTIKEALTQLVTIHGKVYRNTKGQAVRVDEPRIEFVNETEQGPTASDLTALVPDMTGPLTTAEFLERLA